VGSGKTTLLEVLVGERPLSSGTIEIEWSDGSRTSLWREDAYAKFRAGIAYSPQQPFLSNNSMRANIDLSGTRSLEDVQLAVMAAQLTDDLKLLPRGLQEEVGESGINLSGGQKQRVSLARAFLSNRPLLILDDPLSAVDSRTERLLMEQILERSQGLILVSHRLAELERCDRVVVLEGGNVVEQGAPADLAEDLHSNFRRFLKAVEEHEH
jgi:ABC-type multidrug transport system fused ATPase/permease subunit